MDDNMNVIKKQYIDKPTKEEPAQDELTQGETKYCKHCGKKIPLDAVVCVHCGRQVETLKVDTPQVVINNNNSNESSNSNIDDDSNSGNNSGNQQSNSSNTSYGGSAHGGYGAHGGASVTVIAQGRPKSKWVALTLCVLLGYFGAHKFYEDKNGLGVLYLLTFGLFGIGWVVDMLVLLFKSNPYYVR